MKIDSGWNDFKTNNSTFEWFPKPIELKHIKCETSKVRKYKLRKKELEEYLKDIYNKPVNFVK